MNVASLELCKELYELSGWSDTQFEPFTTDNGEHYIRARLPGDWSSPVPAYELGYLLRKLPAQIDGIYDLLLSPIKDGRALILYAEPDGLNQYYTVGNSLEDAAAKLAIELFKQGILERAS